MGIYSDIRNVKKRSPNPKWKILKEHESVIKRMIREGIPLTKQIEIILKNGILEKIDYKQYRNILVDHFGYTGRKPRQIVFEKGEEKPEKTKSRMTFPAVSTEKAPKRQKQTGKRRLDPVAALSEDVDLLDF